MSALLTWHHSGLGAKTGTDNAAVINDLVTLISSKSGDANFKWQVASSQVAVSPFYIVLKRKDASAGRILLSIWTSAPAGANSAILDAAPSINTLYGSFFPNGNVDTPSNLTAASGTILGNDTGVVKVWGAMSPGTIYTANIQPFYFESEESVYFGFQNPATANCYFAGAGNLVVDGTDNEYPAVLSFATGGVNNFGGQTSPLAWSSTAIPAYLASACIRTNYGSANRVYFMAWAPSGPWASSAVSASDILTDTSLNRSYFLPVQLLGQAKNEGITLKLRQIQFGPGTLGAFTAYNTTGPVVAARQFNAATIGGNGYPWFTNFK